MSGLDFLVLVLQKSNSFELNSFFFQLFLGLFLPDYNGDLQLLALRSWSLTGFFSKVENKVSDLFFCVKSSNCFPVKTHVFARSFSFCTFFVMMGL